MADETTTAPAPQPSIFRGDIRVTLAVGDQVLIDATAPASARQLTRVMHYIELSLKVPSKRNRRVKRKDS